MCALLALIVPKELRIAKSRVARFVDAYIGQSTTIERLRFTVNVVRRCLVEVTSAYLCSVYPQVCVS